MKISPFTPHSPFPLPRSPREQGATEKSAPSQEETADHQAELEKLRQRDREVRTHEQAHLAAAGGLATGGATFSFQRGPDGKQYAVGGEVSIDASPVSGNPAATLRKAEQIRAAALAPANPSAQDRAVAASANSLEAQARQELQKEDQTDAASQQGAFPASFSRIDIFA